ncbi:MAG TPA: hypothetical protein VMZ28_26150, partial [Kofleriaceae bacterium]|nr:hypothetical protein [Kofleriaceae bacterium]
MRALSVAVACMVLCGCLESHSVECPGGYVCPAGLACDEANGGCVQPEQLGACDPGDGIEVRCALPGDLEGFCRNGVCLPDDCGDGLITGAETCDVSDPATVGTSCELEGFYSGGAVACGDACVFELSGCTGRCGDGEINGEELCDGDAPPYSCLDLGFDAGLLACSEQVCGLELDRCRAIGWLPVASPVAGDLLALSGTGPDDVFAVGQNGSLAHFDGIGWMAAAIPDGDLTSVSARMPGDAWAVSPNAIYRWDGASWTQVDPAITANHGAVLARRADDVWVFGTPTLRWDGTAWTVPADAPTISFQTSEPTIAWAAGPGDGDDIYVVTSDDGNPVFHRRSGEAWQAIDASLVDASIDEVSGVWGSGPDDVFVGASEGQVLRWDGDGWTVEHIAPSAQTTRALWGFTAAEGQPRSVFAVLEAAPAL